MTPEPAGVRWFEFADRSRGLAREIARIIERYRFAFLGTIRRDGTPRISPVETHLVGDDLMLVVVPRSRKASDLRRDHRLALQSPITDAANPGAEYKLSGRARIVDSADVRRAIARVVQEHSGWGPRPSWLLVAVLLKDATHTTWNPDGTAEMKRWSVGDDRVHTQRLRLDMELGAYRPD